MDFSEERVTVSHITRILGIPGSSYRNSFEKKVPQTLYEIDMKVNQILKALTNCRRYGGCFTFREWWKIQFRHKAKKPPISKEIENDWISYKRNLIKICNDKVNEATVAIAKSASIHRCEYNWTSFAYSIALKWFLLCKFQ